jgi:hypothetical protein
VELVWTRDTGILIMYTHLRSSIVATQANIAKWHVLVMGMPIGWNPGVLNVRLVLA